jgi:Tol biopolymer transport system component
MTRTGTTTTTKKTYYYMRAHAMLVGLAVAALVALATVGVDPAEAAFPGANGKIVFSSDRVTSDNPTGDDEIFVMNQDGTGVEQLTFNTTPDNQPAFFHDGNWIAYVGYRGGDGEIYMRTYDGNLPFEFPLTNNTAPDRAPAFSPDGTKIAFESFRDGNFEIYVMSTADINPTDGNGDNLMRLTNNTVVDSSPNWSPDGSKIAFMRALSSSIRLDEIFVMDADPSTNDATNLTRNAATDREPNWSPNGEKLAFARRLPSSGAPQSPDIYVMNADGSEQKRLTKNAVGDEKPAWSPNGRKIAFTSFRGGDPEIYVMKATVEGETNRPANLTKNDGALDYKPDWQPLVN